MLKIFLGLKYLHKAKIVLLSVAAVAMSSALLIVVSSLFTSYIDAVEKTGRESFGDIYLNPGTSIPHTRELLERVRRLPRIARATSAIDIYGLLRLDTGNIRAVRVWGIEWDSYSEITGLSEALLCGDRDSTPFSGENPGIVGIGVLESPDEVTDEYDFGRLQQEWVGKDVILTTGSLSGSGSSTRLRQKHLKFNISDISFTGMYLRDSKDVFIPLNCLRNLIGDFPVYKSGPHEIFMLKAAEGSEPEQVLPAVRKIWRDFAEEYSLPDFVTRNAVLETSGNLQAYYIAELRKQMKVLILVFGIICSAGILLIFCIFYMIVKMKQKDIAVIKSCGMSDSGTAGIFLLFSTLIGSAGSLLGVLIGFLLIRNINILEDWLRRVSGLKLWKSSTYMFEKIPDQINWEAAAWVVVFSIIAAVIGSLIPSFIAACTRPANLLRYE